MATAAAPAKLPSVINIFADQDGRNVFVAAIKRDLVVKHSKNVRETLEANPTANDVVIPGAAKGPLHHVLEFMKKGKQPLRIGISHEEFVKGIAIFQAVKALDVEPAQPQVENHIIYVITQHMITADQVEIIQRASNRLGTDSRIYSAMVQAVAYNVLHKNFTLAQVTAIKNVARAMPPLDSVIQDKVNELDARAREHAAMMAEKQEKEEKRKAYLERKAKRDEYYNRGGR